jgi:hypothetical protein
MLVMSVYWVGERRDKLKGGSQAAVKTKTHLLA